MGSKKKMQKKRHGGESKARNAGGGGDGNATEKGRQIITDPRFASAHTDPRFRRVPKRETKVAIDSRFQSVFTDKRFSSASAPVDKRGKRRIGKSGKDSLREYYRIEEEEEEKKTKEDGGDAESDEESEEESENESERMMKVGCGGELNTWSEEESGEEASEEEESGEEASEEEDDEEGGEEESTSDEEDVDTEEDDELVYEDWVPELAEETVPEIEKETRRLAVVNMDWRHVSATDLYVMLSSFLPKDGQILSVAVYPSEFGLHRMKEEETHGPVGLFDRNKETEDDDGDEEDEDIINQKLRAYEISRLKYYYAVVECDSSATADYLYKACDGVEFERSSNKLDLRFIPDSMEFKHPPRDVATEAPAKYGGLDYHSRALQLSKVNLSWDEDEPHRAKTLQRKFKAEQMAELELKEFLASDESESDDDEEQLDKKEKKKEKYRALIQSGDNGSDESEKEEDNYQDMEVTFNTELEDLGKRILEKKDNKSETVWEAYLRKRREKKKARKNKHKKDSSSDDDDDDYGSDGDRELMKGGGDDFFVEEPPLKRKKEGKKKQGDKAEKEAAEEASTAELELLLADENAVDGGGVKGYNIKRKGRKGKPDIAEEKIPAADLDDPRFSSLFTSPLFSLDPTDPQFKRSAVYARQLAQKQKGDQKSSGGCEPTKPQLGLDSAARSKDENVKPNVPASKNEKYELSTAIRSVKMKLKQQVQPSSGQRDKDGQRAESSSSLVEKVKKKAKALAK